jgi:hypothetical protein
MSEQALIDALDKLSDKVDELSYNFGLASGKGGGSKGKTGGTGGKKAESASDKAFRETMEQAEKRLGIFRKETDKATDAQKDLTSEQLKAKRAQERTTGAFKDFGMSLTAADANLTRMFDGLGRTLTGTGTTFGKVVGGFAGGVGYALAGLQEFAKSAGDMGAFADLSKFSVGSVTSIKLMSGLGGAFMKVIEESQGGFRAFGANSQEAAENLSNLSRGLKYGSGYLNATLKDSLGTDLVNSVDRASTAAAAMGMTDEERAKLLGSLTQSAMLGAKNEKDAQQRLVKQYGDTLDNTRKLSNAFGISTKEILASMEAFRKTAAGTYASLEGNTGAQQLAPLIAKMGIENDPEKISRIALALSRGDMGAAQANVSNPANQVALEMLNRAVQNGGEGGNNTDAIGKNLKGMSGEMQRIRDERSQYATTAPEYAALGAALGKFEKDMAQGNKDAGKEAPRTSETDNIKSMNSLTAALESLRNVIIGLTAGVALLVGSFGALAVFGAGGGLLSGGLGKVGDMIGGALGKVGGLADAAKNTKAGGYIAGKMGGMFGKKPDFVGPMKPSAGSAVMDKLSGAASKGMEGFGEMLGKLGDNKTVKGAGTLALLGAALALTAVGLKTFNEVEWESLGKGVVALGGLIVMARLVGAATTGIIKGAAAIAILGAAMWIAGKGFKTFNEVEWESMAKGVVALAAFGVVAAAMGAFVVPILLGSAAIAGLGVALGIFGAGAYVAGQAADVFASAIQKVGNVDGVNLIAVGAGLAAIGAGAVVFAAGMVAATATSLVTGLMSLFGAKSPIERILELVPVADKIGMIGEGMFKFGSSIGLINDNLKALDLDALENFKNALVEISNIDLPSLDGLSIPQISTSGITGTPQQGTGLSDMLSGNTAVTPEVISQLMSYLSSIENDLAAIRGNTKQSGYDSPVRLS